MQAGLVGMGRESLGTCAVVTATGSHPAAQPWDLCLSLAGPVRRGGVGGASGRGSWVSSLLLLPSLPPPSSPTIPSPSRGSSALSLVM